MPQLAPAPKFQAFDAVGAPLAGGKLYTYVEGTTTPKATYQDFALGSANTNPVILDARGEAIVFLNGAYKFVLKDSSDVTIWTVDSVRDLTTGQTFASATLSGTLTVSGTTVNWTGNPTHTGDHTFQGDMLFQAPATFEATPVFEAATATWSGNPTHSGNHTFSGNVAVTGTTTLTGAAAMNGAVTLGDAAADAVTVNGTPAGQIVGATYTPTLTNTTNIDSSSVVGTFKYQRVGKTVRVSGRLAIDTTAGGSASTEIGISLPIASAFTAASDLSGGSQGGSTDVFLGVEADSTNDRAVMRFLSGSTTSRGFLVWFDYEII